MARRRPSNFRSRRSKGGSPLPYALGAVVALGLLGGAGWWMSRTASTMAVDAALCPLSGPVAETAILFDLTDPMAPAQTAQLRQYLEGEFAGAAVGTQFTMGVVSEDQALWGATDPLCKPASVKDVSSLTQNVTLVQKRFQERFQDPLQVNLDRMISASGAKTSPIMESLQALVADTPGFLTYAGPRKLILVSDLLQNSDAMSFYRGEDWQSFQASPAFARLGRTLDRVDVTIFAVPREVATLKDPKAVEDFWIRYFELQGANLPKLRSLGDL
ncbi:hypothetical protein NX862_05530 [Rhodobacter sp. KR11]|uniref:hypothetical protein n=1 Tax=Rhodobacter sp. KR11 TaxID=2974588 RepID=UPI002222D58A|nr:hypothetical protein [Rhodobacter sp. KR11]MCW1918205.1 hypothetical protein [Rhodobacter sp. KR11]